ncbi:MAG: SIR2 family protein [Bryobacterales bacterium]|nr:SIR2 family protein [Bryobacterales bacterium]
MTASANDSDTASDSAESPCARRGNQWLTTQDLEAHLAAVVRLEHVGVLLGAGASVGGELGGMTVASLWDHFTSKFPQSATWLRNENFVSSEAVVNVEALTDKLEIARLEWERVNRSQDLLNLKSARADVLRSVVRAAVLQPRWWKSPSAVDLNCVELASHRGLLQKLTSARQPGQPSPWVFSTNYDLAVEWAAETVGLKVANGFDGLHRRVFSPHNFDLGYRNMLARGEARFGTYSIYLAKLHGSLTWQTAEDGTVEEHSAGHLWPRIRNFLTGKVDEIPGNIVYPSAAKYLQTVGFVLGELFRRLTEFLARPQSCLITSGYSFSDDHLNRILSSALQNPTLQLVIYAPEAARDGPDLRLEKTSEWVQRIAAIDSPQVTIIGGGSDAHLSALVEHLPDPAIFDEQAARIREMIKQHREWSDSSTPRAGRAA